MNSVDQTFPFPPWVIRRLRLLYVRFAGVPFAIAKDEAQKHYAALNNGNGRFLIDEHLAWLGRAWMVGGPQLPTPTDGQVPCVIEFLGRMQLEEQLLEGWLLLLCTNHARLHGYHSRSFAEMSLLLRQHSCRRYWCWLMSLVLDIARKDDTWENQLIASRVIAALYREAGLAGLIRRVHAWHTARPPFSDNETTADTADTREVTSLCPLLCPEGAALGALKLKHLATREDLVTEGFEMNNCIGQRFPEVTSRRELFFSAYGPGVGRSSLCCIVRDGRWAIADARSHGNRQVSSRVRFAAEALCAELDCYSKRDPLLSEYLRTATESAKRWELHGQRIQKSGLLHRFIPKFARTGFADFIIEEWSSVT